MQKALAFILAIVLTLGLAACSGDEREPNTRALFSTAWAISPWGRIFA